MNVKRLAAIDMYGSRGTVRRKRIIRAEFTVALAATVALGIWLAVEASGLGTRIFGIWLAGAGIDYAPLAVYAILLSRPGALEAELAGVDTGQELRRYSVLQLWILVPLSLVAMTAQGRKPAPGQLRRADSSRSGQLGALALSWVRSVRTCRPLGSTPSDTELVPLRIGEHHPPGPVLPTPVVQHHRA